MVVPVMGCIDFSQQITLTAAQVRSSRGGITYAMLVMVDTPAAAARKPIQEEGE
jgi:hypothetical protein